jgi:preprotein translocase subunit SecE
VAVRRAVGEPKGTSVTEEREESGVGRERPSTAADRRGRRPAPRDSAAEGKGRATAVRDARPARVSLPKRVVIFLREVVAELRKVIWPSRRNLVTYTLVVLVFVSFMVALVALLDFLVGQGVNALFGA